MSGPRVLMLVINPMTSDARVDREASALAASGTDVTVLATAAPGLPEDVVTAGGYRIVRLPYRRTVKETIVERRRWARAVLPALDHGVRVALRNRRRTSALPVRAMQAVVGLAHLVVLRLRLVTEELRWAAGGLLLKTVRRRLLPTEYWQGSARRALELVERPDVIHAHDLGTLQAALRLARAWGRSGPRPKVVYDSHELYVEQNTPWTRLERLLWKVHERRVIRQADAVITVSPGIAQRLRRRYLLRRLPTVVLNSPTDAPTPSASDVRADAGLPEDAVLAVYVGGVKPGRGVELLVPALAMAPEIHLAILGAGHTSDPHLAAVLDAARAAGVADRVHPLAAVPAASLTSYLRTADVGVHPMEPTCLNHQLALPNKLFDYVFAGLPVAVSQLEEMGRFVTAYGLGATFAPHDPRSVAEGLRRAAARGRSSSEQLDLVRAEHGWDAQRTRLLELYRSLGIPVSRDDADGRRAA